MKIAIISDSHDNISNIEKFLTWANQNKIEAIVHCGDIAAPAVIKQELGPKFSGEIHLVYGNVADRELLPKVCEQFTNCHLYGDVGEITIEGDIPQCRPQIAFCHFPEVARKMAESGQYDLVFYGHTHKPWIENIGQTILANPGTLAGMFQKATFAVYDTASKNLELKALELL